MHLSVIIVPLKVVGVVLCVSLLCNYSMQLFYCYIAYNVKFATFLSIWSLLCRNAHFFFSFFLLAFVTYVHLSPSPTLKMYGACFDVVDAMIFGPCIHVCVCACVCLLCYCNVAIQLFAIFFYWRQALQINGEWNQSIKKNSYRKAREERIKTGKLPPLTIRNEERRTWTY